ncbi:MAG TPA: biotin transporter BioY [Dongiaceae bacterium]|nr:biotin transporter BioY [Dongiaceae bacterium]
MHTTLAAALWTRITTSRLHQVLLVVLGTVLLAISAQIQVPFWPVPMTMQTFMVLIIGATYGARLGGLTVAAYLAEGAIGLPVFAQFSAGAHVLVGPTAGYLFGFVAAAVVTGYLAERGYGRNLATAAISFILGTIVIFACGLAYLASLIGVEGAITHGLMPFILSEPTKVALATLLLPTCWKLVRR